jgi:hypothetical protein
MPTTPNYGFYSPPLTGVTPDVPRDLATLAGQMDTALKQEQTNRAAGDVCLRYEGSIVNGAGVVPVATGEACAPAWSATPVSNTLGVTQSSRAFVIPLDGVYHLDVSFVWASNATGARKVMIWLNPSSDNNPQPASVPPGGTALLNKAISAVPTYTTTVGGSRIVPLTAGTKVMFATLQTSGANLDLQAQVAVGRTSNTWCSIVRLGDLVPVAGDTGMTTTSGIDGGII